MDEQQLIDRLEARAADVPVGAPPIDAMRSAVRRRRARMPVLAAAAAVVVLTAGVVAVQAFDVTPDPEPPVASDPVDPDAPPAGTRYVGIGTAVIAVSDTWGTNETECGTPVEDTVIIDVGVTCLMAVPRPADVDSVRVERSLEGVPPVVGEVTTSGGITSGSVVVEGVVFSAESSSADGKAIVEELLASITILENHTTVPGFQEIALRRGPTPAPPMIESYTTMLQELGLSVEVVTEKSDLDDGTVLGTDPAVGSIVGPGDTVTVTVSG